MSGPSVEQTAEPGARTTLSEEEWQQFRAAVVAAFAPYDGDPDGWAELIAPALDSHVAALVAAAEERGAAKERERAAKGAAGLRGSHPTMKRGILCLQLATPDDAMESIRRALPDLIAAYAELTVPPVGPPGAERWPS